VNKFLAANRALWDEWTTIHEHSAFYDLHGFRRGGIRIADHELDEIGPVDGLSLLHLQCHFGIDTLSWARLGARATGVDFSPSAIALARSLANDLQLDARFIESDVYQLPEVLDETFDLVYTSKGVLGWLPDVARWADVVARFVRPGGRFYILEIHPVAQAFEDEGVELRQLQLKYPYWEHVNPLAFPTRGSYANESANVNAPMEYSWDHSLGEIVTSLAAAGLRVDALREYPFLNWKLDFLEQAPDGTWRLPPGDGELPLMFSILASKPSGRWRRGTLPRTSGGGRQEDR
jgi:ubiquinone/menaquinone biosynthesis C-methylase UbiE